MSLFGFLESYLLTGLVSNFAYDSLRKLISQGLEKSIIDVYADSIVDSLLQNQAYLKEHFRFEGVNFRRDIFLQIFQQPSINIRPSDIVSQATEPIDKISDVFLRYSILELENHQLTDNEYLEVVKLVLSSARDKFISIISKQSELSQYILIDQIERMDGEIRQIKAVQEETRNSQIKIEREYFSTSTSGNLPLIRPFMPFKNSENSIIEDIQIHSINYLDNLITDINTKPRIDRQDLVTKIINELETHVVVAIVGEPGVGKTYLLGDIGKQSHGIYISLKGKSAYQIFTYILREIKGQRKEIDTSYASEEQALISLEHALKGYAGILLIDDGDSSPDVIQRLLGIKQYSTKMVIGSRSREVLRDFAVHTIKVSSFSDDEVSRYLERINRYMPPGKQQELIQKSQGNPLYLYYFSVQQIDPLPDGIAAYQDALWRSLNQQQKTILYAISVSHFLISTPTLYEVVDKVEGSDTSLVSLAKIIETLEPIIITHEGTLEIFHSFFRENIVVRASEIGIIKKFHTAIGEVALEKNNKFFAAYHLLKAGDQRANSILLDGANSGLAAGFFNIAEELVLGFLDLSKGDEELADDLLDAYFLLAIIYGETSRFEKGQEYIQLARNKAIEQGESSLALHIESWAIATFIHGRDADQSIQRVQEIIEAYDEDDLEYRAASIVNLSNICVRTARFKLGMKYARQAFELFNQQNNMFGKVTALTNIAACFGGIDDYAEQERYGILLVEEAEKLNSPRLRATGLNNLAICQRKKGQHDLAQKSLLECISIAQKLGDPGLEALNLNNLGNVFFDLKDYSLAENCYKEAEEKANTHKIMGEVARAKELTARIRTRSQEYDEVITLCNQAIEIYTSIKDDFRVASAIEELAWAYEQKGDHKEAGENYIIGARIYQTLEHLDDAADYYSKAVACWINAGDSKLAKECLRSGIECASQIKDFATLGKLLVQAMQFDRSHDYSEMFDQAFQDEIQKPKTGSIASFMFAYMSYLKIGYDDLVRRDKVKELLYTVRENFTKDNQQKFLILLAIIFDQIDSKLLTKDDFRLFVSEIPEWLDGLYYSAYGDDEVVFTVGTRWKNGEVIQLVVTESEFTTVKLAACEALLIYCFREEMDQVLTKFRKAEDSDELGLSFYLCTRKNYEKYVSKIDNEIMSQHPFCMAEASTSSNPVSYLIGIIDESYQGKSDWLRNPDNRLLASTTHIFLSGIVGYFLHSPRDVAGRDVFRMVTKLI